MGTSKLGRAGISPMEKEIGVILCDFYDMMKSLESDKVHGDGKQATAIIMAISDIRGAVKKYLEKEFLAMRLDEKHHLGMGDIRLTIGEQGELCELRPMSKE